MMAQWNAVKLYNEWRLVDVHWACACVLPSEDKSDNVVHMVNEFYFLTDPDALIGTHFPDKPKWQLLPHPITKERFFNLPKFGDRFFKLGLRLSSQTKLTNKLQTVKGTVVIPFEIPENNALNLKFRYMIYNTEIKGSRHLMERYVLYQKTFSNVEYIVRLPRKGHYKMDVYGLDNSYRYYDLVCSYTINCPSPYVLTDPLPESPAIGWGPRCVEAVVLGLKPKQYTSAQITLKVTHCLLYYRINNNIND